MEEIETWEANGRVVLKKFDHAGGLRDVLINKGRKVQLTEKERLLNQDYCIEDELDPFVNGTLSIVRLPKVESESLKAIVENPNTMSESEIVELLTVHHATFSAKLDEITSPYIVRKMIAAAESDDVDVSAKRLEKLEAKLRELTKVPVNVVEHHRVVSGEPDS